MKTVDYIKLKGENVADFLILTATKTETQAFLNIVQPIGEDVLEVFVDGRLYYIGRLGQYNVIQCQCTTMGASGEGSSIITCNNAFSDWDCIKQVIMVGIAFGMYNEAPVYQKYGDVLIADKIYPYESQRVGDEIKYRGEPCVPSSDLVKSCYAVKRKWSGINYQGEDCHADICPLVTGEKLVDNLVLRNMLKKTYPDAKGGEMEGQGVSSACSNVGKPWLLIKGICDFADGNKGEQKHEKQVSAANLAFDFCVELLEIDNLLKEVLKSSFRYSTKTNARDALFQIYDLDKEPYYIQREIDEFLELCLKTHGCWVFGESGVGKSVALTRALTIRNSSFVLIDLSTCLNFTVDEIFEFIYECLLEENDKALKLENRTKCIKAILSILEKKFFDKEVFLFIEEIPIDGEDAAYGDFVKSLYALIISAERNLHHVKVRLVLSSINSPKRYLSPTQSKIESYLKFKEMGRWSDEECVALVGVLCQALGVSFSDGYSCDQLVSCLDNSPRKIKNCFNQAVACNQFVLDEHIVKHLIEY